MRSTGKAEASRVVVVAVATEWHSKHGGVSTFNRQLCVAIRRRGHEVFCYLPDADPDEHEEASREGVNIITATPMSGLDKEAWVLGRPPLPQDPHVIISHGTHTGPAADFLQAYFFPNSVHVHFVHTLPERAEFLKPEWFGTQATRAETKRDQELHVCRKADVVVGVGPLITKEFATLLVSDDVEVHEFRPGLFSKGSLPRKVPELCRCLVPKQACCEVI